MTREEAIETLKANYPDACYKQLREAVDAAIEALKAQIDKDANATSTDIISRQAAVSALHGYFDGMLETDTWSPCDVYGLIEILPSAQQWIPCSERMPGADGTYLVYAPDYKGGSSSSKECHDGVMFSRFKNKKWSVEHGYYTRPNCVKAWMPFPKPYKGGE